VNLIQDPPLLGTERARTGRRPGLLSGARRRREGDLPGAAGPPWPALSRLHVPDIRAEVIRLGLVTSLSGTSIWRWLSKDAIKPGPTGAGSARAAPGPTSPGSSNAWRQDRLPKTASTQHGASLLRHQAPERRLSSNLRQM